MNVKERRHSQRYQMHYPIAVSSARGIDSETGWHYGEILDASRNGIRLRVKNFGTLQVGSMLQMLFQPASGRVPDNRCRPVPIQGLVVWEDASADEFALQYRH